MASKTVHRVTLTAGGGVNVEFTDGSGKSYPSRAGVAADSTVQAVGSDDWLTANLLARWLALNPALDDPSLINGVTHEVNMTSVLNPMTFGSV